MSKKWSVDNVNLDKYDTSGIEKKKKKKWSVDDVDLSKYDLGVDADYINTFLNESQSYLKSQSNRGNSYKSGVSAYDDFANSDVRKDLNTRASNIRVYLNANKSNLDSKAYSDVMSYLDAYKKDNSNLLQKYRDVQNYYSQWNTEQDYNSYIKNNENTLKYSQMSIEDLKKEKEEYDKVKKDVNFSKYSNALAPSGNPQGEAVSKFILELMDKKNQNETDYDSHKKWEEYYKDKDVLFKDINGNAVTYESLIAEKENDKTLEEIEGNPHTYSAYVNALEASKKRDMLNEELEAIYALKTASNAQLPTKIPTGEQNIVNAIKQEEAIIEDFNNLGYDIDKLRKHVQMKEGRESFAQTAAEDQKYAEENGWLASAKANFVYPAMMIEEYIENLVDTAKYGSANIYDDTYTNRSQIYNATVGQNIDDWVVDVTGNETAGWLASSAYSGISSAALSGSILLIGTLISGNPKVGAAAAMSVMFTQGSANSFQEAIKNGSSNEEAVATSVVSGIGEALFELLPLDNLFKLGAGKTVTKEGLVSLLKGLAKQSAIEGLEEGGTELWNAMADAIINGDHSAYNMAVRQYIQQGYSGTDAHKMASEDWLKELASSMVGGFFGGAAMGGAVGIPSYTINQGIQNAQYKALGESTIQNQNVEDLVADAQSLVTEGEKNALNKLANKVAGVENVDNLSKRQTKKYTKNVGKLVSEVANVKANSIESAQIEAIRHELEANGVENVDYAAEIVVKKFKGESLTEAETNVFESVDGDTIIEKVNNLDVQSMVDRDNLQRTKESLKKTGEMVFTPNKSVQLQQMIEESGYKTTEGKTTIDATGVEVDSIIIDSIEKDDVSLLVKTGDDSTIVSAGELNLNDNYAVMIEGLKRIGNKYNLKTSSANKLLALYEAYNGDAFTFYKAMEAAISYGQFNMRKYFDNNEFVKDLPQEYQEKLFEIGKENTQTKAEEKQALVELEGRTKATGKVTFAEGVKYHKLNKSQKAQVDFAQVIAKAFGFDLEVFQSPKDASGQSIGENGSYSASRTLMRLDIDAGTLDGKSLILFTQSHELTHHIKEWSSVKYKALADFLVDRYVEKDVPIEALIKQKIEQSKIATAMDKTGNHHVLTKEEAFDEIVANACEDFLADPKIQQAIIDIAKIDQSLADKIKNFIKNLIARLDKALRGLQGQSLEAQFVRELDIEDIQELKKLWMEALLDARENVLEARERTTEEQEVIEEFGEDLGNVEYTEDGDVTLISSKDGSTQVYSERTWLNGGKEALIAALTRNEHTQEEVNDTIKMVEDTLDYLKILAAGDAQMRGYKELADNLVADITTDIKGKKQVLHAIVNNGDYPVNIDLALICKKRVAYMNVMTRLIADGVMENVKYDGDAIAEVNAILRKNGFETACLGCFVESRRLQFQTWAETIVQEWNGEVDKRNKNAGSFNYTKNAFTDASSLTDEELNKLDKELSGKKKNKQGNLNLGQGSAIARMGKLLDSAPTLQKHISVADLLTPEGLTKLRAENPNLFSIVKSRYGAATPKIVQKYNPYASELANLTFKSVSDITTNSVKGSQEYLKEAQKELAASKPALPKGMKKGEFNKSKAMKDWNAKVETLAMRKYLFDIGGARMQSFSDFMIENVFDYMQIFADLAANKFPLHSYTKEAAFLRLFGMTGAKINGSLIAHVDKTFGKKYAGLMSADAAKNGNAILVHTEDGDFAIGFDDYTRHMATKGTKGETFIQSIGMKDIIALQMDKRYSKNIGSITIGVSDVQILAMLDSPLFRMVIPYHASGMLPQFAQLVGVDMYNDYTNYQNTTVKQYFDLNKMPLADETNDKGETKLGTLKKANGKSINADTSYNFNAELQKIGDPKTVADNYIAWCNEFHEVYDGKTLVGYAKFSPKFSNSPYGTDFTKHENYYKLLEDFNVYDGITEQYAAQGAVRMIFPSAETRLSAQEMEEYKQRLRDTGIFSEKEIEKYAKKANMTFEEIIKAEVKNRVDYEDAQKPKWESTIKEIEDKLEGKYSRENKPTNAYAYDWKKPYSIDWQFQDRDSEGRELSPEQVEFFKDSKVRDAEGLLIPMYHGTDAYDEITVFKKGKTGYLGGGIYLTSDKNYAKRYANKNGYDGRIYETYVDIKNPLVVTSSHPAYEILGEKVAKRREAKNSFETHWITSADIKKLQAKGYDGVVWDFGGTVEVSVWNPNQIKNIDNLNPTESDDIRYSERVSNQELAERDDTALYIKNTKKANYIGMIFNGMKTEETRSRRTLDAFIGKDFYVTDGEKVYGKIVLGKPHKYTYEDFHKKENQKKHRVPKGDTYDIKEGGIKWAYPIESYERFAKPVKMSDSTEYKNSFQARQVLRDDIRYQDRVTPAEDAEYLELAKNPEANEARLREMVDEAAKKAGYTQKVYHGTNAFGFTRIDTKRSNDRISFFATDSVQTAGTYSGTSGVRNISDANSSSLGMYQLYANTNEMMEFDAEGAESNHIALGLESGDFNYYLEGKSWHTHATAKQIAKYAKQKGYRGVIIKNVIDTATPDSRKTAEAANIYIFFDPRNQVKSADLVTYDDSGNIILLSERFNEGDEDIRYQDRYIRYGKLTQNRIDYLIKDSGAGSRVDYANKWIATISPSDFIDLTLRYETRVKGREVFDTKVGGDYGSVMGDRDYIHVIRHNRELPYLMVDMDTGKVLGHNGRHRMRALEMAGASRTPIGIIFYKNDYVYKGDDNGERLESIDVQRLTSQFDDKSYLQHNAYIHNIIPLNEDHRKEIEGTYRADKFEVEHFDVLAYQDRPYKPSLEELGLRKENENLKADVENLKAMLKLQSTVTHGKVLAKAKYKDIAKKLLHEFGMKQVRDEDLLNGFVQRLDKYFSSIINSDELTWEFVMEGAYEVARWAERTMPDIRQYKHEYAEEFLKGLSKTKVTFTEAQKVEAAYSVGGTFNEYRKLHFGKFKIVNEGGEKLTNLWGDLVSEFGGVIRDEYIQAGQVEENIPYVIVKAIDDMRETESVFHEEEIEMRIDSMAQKIYDAYWLMPTVKTLADKHQKEVNLLKGKHREQMDALRETYKEKEIKTKEDYKKRYSELAQKIREQKDAKLDAYKEHVKEVRINERDRKNRTVMKNRIKGVVKKLNTVLNRGTKDKNVKIPIQPAVAKALELAEYLFEDEYSNKFILTQADINPRQEEIEDVEKYRKLNDMKEKHMETLLSIIENEGMEAQAANLKDTISEIERKMGYLEKKLASLITNEKKNLQAGGVGESVKALSEAYAQLKESKDDYVKEAYDEGIYNYIKGLADKLEGAKVKEMSADQMYDVYTAFKAVLTTVRHANKLFINGKKEDVQQMASNIMMEISSNKKTKTVPYEKLDTLKGKLLNYTWNELKPYYAFQRIGSPTLMKLYEAARQGEDVLGKDYNEAIEFAEKIKNKYGYNSWDMNKRYDIKLEDGRTFSVTLQEIMSIYAYSKREQAYDHMMFGGFVFNNKKFFKSNEGVVKGAFKPKTYRSTDAEAYRLSIEDIAKINKIIDKVNGLKGFVDEMQAYLSTDMAAKGNEISRVLYGVDWFNEENYFPIKSSRDFLAIVNNPSENYSLRNSGMTKSTVPHAKNPLVLEDFMKVWSEHVGKMSTYHAFVIPIDNLNKVLSYKEASVSTKTVLDSVFGKSAKEYLDNFLKDLNGGVSSQGAKSPVASMFGKFKKTAVAASSSVVVQQPTAILRAMAEIDGKYFVGASDKLKHNEKWELIKKYAPIAVIKELGGFDIGSGKTIETILTMQSYKGKEKVKGFLTDSDYRNNALDNAFMWGATKADEIGWNIIWSAVEREIKDTTSLKNGTEEFYQKVGKRFTEVVHKTQVYDSTFTRSGFQRSKSDLVQMSMSFMGEPTTSFNMLYDAILQSSRKNISKGKAAKIVGATVASIIMAAAMKSFIYALRDDDEDKSYLEKYLESTTESLISDLMITNMLPFVKDITSIISGWSVERTDFAIFTDIYNSVKQLSSDNVSDYRKVEDLIGSLAALLGIPAKNLLRTGREMYNVGKNIFDNNVPYGQGVSDAIYRGLPFTEDKAKTDKIYWATVNGTQAYLDKFEGEDIDNSLKKGLRDNDNRILKAVDALLNSDYSTYGSIVNQIVAEGHFTKDIVAGAIQSEANYFGGKIEEGAEALRDGNDKAYKDIVKELRDRYRGIYTQDEIIKMIKNYEFEAEDTSDKEKSIYKTKYIIDALENGDTSTAITMIEDVIATKVANGMTEEEAAQSVRGTLTSYWKPLYQQAFENGDKYEQNSIRDSLYDMGVYGSYEDIDDTLHGWKQNYVLETYKPQYIQAYQNGDTAEMRRIENKVYSLGVYKNAYKTVRGWVD